MDFFSSGARNVSVEGQGPVGRVMNSFGGMCCGFFMFFACIFLLGWNEFNYVRNQAIILVVQKDAVNIPCTPSPQRQGQLVNAACQITYLPDLSATGTGKALKDNGLLNPAPLSGVALKPQIEILQWEESKTCTKRKSDGRNECTYTYSIGWGSSPSNSDSFHCDESNIGRDGCPYNYPAGGYRNPGSAQQAFQSLGQETVAAQRSVGFGDRSASASFGLDAYQVGAVASAAPQRGLGLNAVGRTQYTSLLTELGVSGYMNVGPFGQCGGSAGDKNTLWFTNAGTDCRPVAGDLKVSYALAAPNIGDPWTVLAQQTSVGGQYTFQAFDTHKKGTMNPVDWIYEGSLSVNDMVQRKNSENSGTTMVLRIVGFVLMFISLMLITGPIVAIPEMLPCVGQFLGEVVGCVLAIINFCIAVAVSLLTIGVAWLAARPAIGGAMLAVAAGLMALSVCVAKRHRKARGAGAVPLVQPQAMEQGMAAPGSQPMVQQYAAPYSNTQAAPVYAPHSSTQAPPAFNPAAAGQRMTVTCPAGCGPGAAVQVQTPAGMRQFVVPQGVMPGQAFEVQY